MRTSMLLVPFAGVVLAALAGCETSGERVVYVPATTSGTMVAGDPLGIELMNSGGVLRSARASSLDETARVAFTHASSSYTRSASTSQFVESPQGGYVTMASTMPAYARSRQSEVRMPLITFAATDGPSAD